MRVCCLQPLGKGPGWAEERQGVSQLRPWPATFVPPLSPALGPSPRPPCESASPLS